MISLKEAEINGIEVVKLATQHFYATNSEQYQIYGYEQADLEQYLHETILVRRYLRSVELTPEFYEGVKNYRSSLYVACRKALLAHYRQITAKKRCDLFRKGAIVRIDIEREETEQLPQFEGSVLFRQVERTDVVIKRVADHLLRVCELTSALFILVAHNGLTKASVMKAFPFLKQNEVDRSFSLIQSALISQLS